MNEYATFPTAQTSEVCDTCHGMGFLVDRTDLNLPVTMPCECTKRKIAARAAAEEQYRRDLLSYRLRQSFGRLADCTLTSFDLDRPLASLTWGGATWKADEQREMLRRALERAAAYANGAPGWLYLVGPCGAGKSHLAAAIVNELVYGGATAAYASVPELLAFIRSGFKDNTADERLNLLKGVDVLVLDDLGTEQGTEWALEQLFVLINHRYLEDRTTIITSNLQLAEQPARIASRIAEVADEIVLPVADYRMRNRV